MQRSLLTSALLCGVPSAIVASEVMDDGDGAALSGSWDANADGKVTRDEVPMERRRFFDRAVRRADANGDQSLDAGELARLGAAKSSPARGDDSWPGNRQDLGDRDVRPMGLFALLDRDGDGKLSKNELARGPRLLGRFDRDGDGFLSRRELVAPEPGKKKPKKKPKNKLGKKKKGARSGERSRRRWLERLDTDKDGFLSKEEVRGRRRLAEAFERVDKNGDGRLGPAELKALARG